ncbi:YraN family protein [Anaerotalea alkaliphila]|uniref:UPF0102 protein GXN74_00930 n=1 Tax=Anaerotalea alkaliphila TaxID=2662126 RepID=A0A7X5HTL4_9FIRM|nr:YraN family protein [Anaerotalea alkaliphila]
MNNQEKGRQGEDRAAAFLEAAGYRVLARNYRCVYGEVDIVALDPAVPEQTIFIEVKYRKTGTRGNPWEAVNRTKQQRIIRTSAAYLREHGGMKGQVRYDVLEMDDRKVVHHPCAFDASGMRGI